jgi:hypothetical protein
MAAKNHLHSSSDLQSGRVGHMYSDEASSIPWPQPTSSNVDEDIKTIRHPPYCQRLFNKRYNMRIWMMHMELIFNPNPCGWGRI